MEKEDYNETPGEWKTAAHDLGKISCLDQARIDQAHPHQWDKVDTWGEQLDEERHVPDKHLDFDHPNTIDMDPDNPPSSDFEVQFNLQHDHPNTKWHPVK